MLSSNSPLPSSLFSSVAWIKPLRLTAAVFIAPFFVARPASAQADSAPKLLSTTGGGSTWSDVGELQKAAASGNPKARAALGDERRHVLVPGRPRLGGRAIASHEKNESGEACEPHGPEG